MISEIAKIVVLIAIFLFGARSAGLPKFTYDEQEINAARVAALNRHNLYRCMHAAPALMLDDEVIILLLINF